VHTAKLRFGPEIVPVSADGEPVEVIVRNLYLTKDGKSAFPAGYEISEFFLPGPASGSQFRVEGLSVLEGDLYLSGVVSCDDGRRYDVSSLEYTGNRIAESAEASVQPFSIGHDDYVIEPTLISLERYCVRIVLARILTPGFSN